MSITLLDKIKSISKEIHQDVIQKRRHLHANPELSFEEFNTASFVKSQLEKMGIPYQEMANTGVVGLIKGNKTSDKVVALRADMDALPIIEANEVPYKSKNNGVMHACGHDVHTSSLLGTAEILNSLKNDFEGTV
jgi:amidohydrolase